MESMKWNEMESMESMESMEWNEMKWNYKNKLL